MSKPELKPERTFKNMDFKRRFQAIHAQHGDQPFAMLNLLKFKPDGGKESYAKYGESVTPLVAKVGGKVPLD